ncbi:MAG: DUF2147 domain-containing protein [Prolixibacteraceae bacterium]
MWKGLVVVLLAIVSSWTTIANDDIEGKWKTIDDLTGEIKSIVEISVINGEATGKIIELFNEDPMYNPDCKACKGDLKDNKILGMSIINGLKFCENKWVGRKGILDPDNGKFYYCKLWVDQENPNKLYVRGYIGFFFRAQTWLREK